MEAKWIQADMTVINVKPQNGTDFSLNELKAFVHGYIEIVNLYNGQILVCNEEGAINGSPYNEIAHQVLQLAFQKRMQPIFGDVLICDEQMVK